MGSSLEQSDPGTKKRTNEWKGVVILEVDLGGGDGGGGVGGAIGGGFFLWRLCVLNFLSYNFILY